MKRPACVPRAAAISSRPRSCWRPRGRLGRIAGQRDRRARPVAGVPPPHGLVMEVELQFTVENLLARYVHVIDDGRLEEWPELFVEEGRYRVTTAENEERKLPLPIIQADSRAMLRDRVNSLRHANIYEAQRYRHAVSSTLVERID